jgi:hypothetical protein
MKGMLAQLSPHEETALRKIAVGSDDVLDPAHVRRLHQLDLVKSDGRSWRLTALGSRRHEALVNARVATPASAA